MLFSSSSMLRHSITLENQEYIDIQMKKCKKELSFQGQNGPDVELV